MKCLEKTVERRYQNIGHLADDLQRYMDGGRVYALSETSPSSPQLRFLKEGQEFSQSDSSTRTTTLKAVGTRTKSWWQFWR